MVKLLTPAEVAVTFGVTEATVLRWHREGRLASVKIGQQVRFTAEAVDSLLDASGGK